ncbi:hypothetical protein [Nocardioides sp.]|uniref:hypothetical protein n=1 Tax=Nocardioides sp. TaxID=35761 RepID=UPI002CFFA7DF|nr:hypothetical protein [Nocardioides sp.]HSX67404.1 hypothetical protein [Nocardioides sp.]
MEIVPGRGVLNISLGMDRDSIAEVLGAPTSVQDDSAFYGEPDPGLVLRFSADGLLELIELPYAGNGNEVS